MKSKRSFRIGETKVNWKRTLEREGLLIQHILLYQRTMRVAGIVPTYANFLQTEVYWEMMKELDTTDLAKYRAWWELIFDCQRHQDDRPSVVLAIAYIVQETQRRSYSKMMPVLHKPMGIDDAHAAMVKDTVLKHFEKLHPSRDGVKLSDATAPLLA